MALHPRNKRQRTILLAAIAILAILYGLWTQQNKAQDEGFEPLHFDSATILAQPRIIEDFKLVGIDNAEFSKDNLKGKWNLMFFGFTNCPMICPTTLTELNKAYKQLEHNQQSPMPQVVLVSVDPERDDPATMKEYLSSFNSAFLGATGDKEEISKLTKQMGVMYAKVMKKNAEDDSDYDVEHSGAVLVISPKGDWYALFGSPLDPSSIVKDFPNMVKQFERG